MTAAERVAALRPGDELVLEILDATKWRYVTRPGHYLQFDPVDPADGTSAQRRELVPHFVVALLKERER